VNGLSLAAVECDICAGNQLCSDRFVCAKKCSMKNSKKARGKYM